MNLIEIPLFPLGTVLFPGGILPLRIFEPRYVTMVGECMREGKGFGVVLIREGREAGTAAKFFATGTVAHIIDFDQLDDGMLGLTCRGGDSLRVQDHHVRSDQLIVGEVELIEAEPSQPMPVEHRALSEFLQKVLEREEAESYRRGLQEDWDDAGWIACRLAELLPLAATSKQTMLESDLTERLSVLHAVMDDNDLL